MVAVLPEGLVVKRVMGLCVMSGLVMEAAFAAQPLPLLEPIVVTVRVNYGSAYHDQSWVPVDVYVRNLSHDIAGHIEIEAFSYNQQQSPVYRIPMDSPKDSEKRFRAYCYLNQTTDLRVQLYDGRRPALEFPKIEALQPVGADAVLTLILDDDYAEYGFLYTLIQPEDGGGVRPFHREGLVTEDLPLLAEHTACYRPFDAVVIGDVDAARIGPEQQAAIERYVRGGGVLVVCTGNHAAKLRGTWVEDVLGTQIGATETVNEDAFAQAAFEPALRDGARPGRPCVYAQLHPVAPEVQTLGSGPVLSTMRPLGSGFAVALAIDAPSKDLASTAGYERMWRELLTLRSAKALDYGQAADITANALPALSGIRIYPRSAVINYLLAYFLIAIVGNFVVFSLLKRREWAWGALIVFSAAFTFYAMYYGGASRAKATEVEQVDIVHIPRGSEAGEMTSLVGVLAARSSWHTLRLHDPQALAADVSTVYQPVRAPGRMGANFTRRVYQPAVFVQDGEPRMEAIRIGASDLRLMQVETEVPLRGGIGGEVVWEDGMLSARLVNKTGLRIQDAQLVVHGELYPLESTRTGWTVTASGVRLRSPVAARRLYATPQQFAPGMDFSGQVLEHQLLAALFGVGTDAQPGREPVLGAYVWGRIVPDTAGGAAMNVASLEGTDNRGVWLRLVAAEVPLRSIGEMQSWVPVPIESFNQHYDPELAAVMPGPGPMVYAFEDPWSFVFRLPPREALRFPLVIEVTARHAGLPFRYRLTDGGERVREPDDTVPVGELFQRDQYVIPSWETIGRFVENVAGGWTHVRLSFIRVDEPGADSDLDPGQGVALGVSARMPASVEHEERVPTLWQSSKPNN